jgi:hypothetical protein
MTKALAHTYETIHFYRILIMRLVCAMIVLSLAWYGFNVYTAISHTVAAEHIQKQISEESVAVNKLGASYIELAHEASPVALKQYGMTAGTVSAYIHTPPTLGAVLLTTHEL